jgi:multiple sugar transport system permease protein
MALYPVVPAVSDEASNKPRRRRGIDWNAPGRDRDLSLLMLAPAVFILVFTNLFPVLEALQTSFYLYDLSIPNATPLFIGLENYQRLLSDDAFLSSFRTTLIFVTIAVSAELILGIGLGLLITGRSPFVGILRVVLLLSFIMAPVAAGVLWRTLYNVSWGPINYFIELLGFPRQEFLASTVQALGAVIAVEVWQQVPPVAFVVAAGISSVPTEIYRAAAVDGANAWKRFWWITLPLVRPVIFVVLILRTMDAFKVFDIVATLTQGGPASATKLVSYHIWERGLRFLDIGYASAMSWLFLLVVFVISLFFIRALDRARAGTEAAP